MSDTQNRQPIPQRLTAIHAALDLLRGSFDEAALRDRLAVLRVGHGRRFHASTSRSG